MVDIAISALTEDLNPNQSDDVVVETVAGTRRSTITNILPRSSDLTTLTAANVNLTNDKVGVWDGTDSRLKGVTAFDIIFGIYGNINRTDDFTLAPTTDNLRPIECSGTFTTGTITLSGATADQGGAQYTIHNLTTGDLTLDATNGMTLYENGVSVSSATISRRTSATIWVDDGNNEAIISGG